MIGIICAMQLEADGIVALSENVKEEIIGGMKFYTAALHGREFVVVVCGEGKVNAAMCTATLIREYSPSLIINSGVAGALSPIVSVGDLVVGSKAVEHDMNGTALGYKQGEVNLPGQGMCMYFDCDKAAATRLAVLCKELPGTRVAQGIIASGDVFISDRKKRLLLNDRFGAVACEMEGAAIGHVCRCFGVPFAILRAISDDLDENKGMDFVKFCRLAADKTVKVLDKFLLQTAE
ncbi:MAG: 5'-methylthioadenosine/adenosylhomocysteine nucleosidase [Ruminococcus sp.]|nr:5'-methylthioadenosine/adenosylhomocysteine nucleosidase [Ruminococcus sp.]